jgi:EF-P beta-lysylation protein EpmB
MSCSIPLWRKIQRENFTSLQELSAYLELSQEQQQQLEQNSPFPLNLPRRLAEKIQKRCLEDPIFRQFVPLKSEGEKKGSFVKDPVEDCRAARTSKFLQKYHGRALLLTTGACAMHCRFCFRQNYEYAPLQTGFSQELQRIEQDPTLKEVILSGGDPLSMGNTLLKELIESIATIEHVQRIRFHTRFPIGIPERIDEEFLSILERCQKQIWFVIHCNHPRELDQDVIAALKKIQKLAIPVLNQWVLLKGVNDRLEVMQMLCEKLVDFGVLPYYLHQLDKVEGAAHFEVSQETGRELIGELNVRLAGYALPKYVQEVPSKPSKIELTPLMPEP